MKLIGDHRIRDGLAVALLAVVAALTFRLAITNADDHLHYAVVEDLTGLDFGTWPEIFYSGGGGDGEVFAVLAADPFGEGPSQLIPSVVYRFSRIGFSLFAWAASFGNEAWVLPALFAVGLASVGAVGFLTGFSRARLGWRAWFLLINPAIFIGFNGDTAEPLAVLLLAGCLLGGGIWASMILGLTRPTYAVSLAGRWRLVAAAIFAFVVVRIAGAVLFPDPITDTPAGLFEIPLAGYIAEPSIIGLSVLGAGLLTFVVGATRRDLGWLAAGALVLVFGGAILEAPLNAVRAAGMLPVLWAFGPNWRPSEKSGQLEPST